MWINLEHYVDTLNFVIDILKECLEDLEDYESAISSYDSIDMSDSTTLEDLCNEVGIDYITLEL